MSGGRRRELAHGRRPSAPAAGWPAPCAGQTEDDSSAAPMARREASAPSIEYTAITNIALQKTSDQRYNMKKGGDIR